RGFDPRDFALVAFGGSGGLHACEIAETLDIPTILVPANPGMLSALGMLLSDSVCDLSQTLLVNIDLLDAGELSVLVAKLSREAQKRMRDEGFEDNRIRIETSVDVRYVGQAYELNVPFTAPDRVVRSADGWSFVSAFHAAHERMYGYADWNRPVELVNVRVRGVGLTHKPRLLEAEADLEIQCARPVGERLLFADGHVRSAPVFDRASLAPGDAFGGPALAVDEGSTTLIAKGWTARVDTLRNLIVSL